MLRICVETDTGTIIHGDKYKDSNKKVGIGRYRDGYTDCYCDTGNQIHK